MGTLTVEEQEEGLCDFCDAHGRIIRICLDREYYGDAMYLCFDHAKMVAEDIMEIYNGNNE